MRYFHSQKSFSQYKPHQSFWQKLKNNFQKKSANTVIQPTLKNPFKKEVAVSKNRTKLVWFFLIFIILAWILIMLTVPYFKINKLIIEGNKINKTFEIQNYALQTDNFKFGLMPKTNYFLFKNEVLAQEIKRQFLYENVEVNKIFPDTIKITITEKPANVIFDNGKNYYLLDSDGKIIKKITDISPEPDLLSLAVTSTTGTSSTTDNKQNSFSDNNNYNLIQNTYGQLPIVKDSRETENDGGILLDKKLIESSNTWEKNLRQQSLGEARYFQVGYTDFNLKIFFKNKPWYVLINTDLDFQIQIRNLKIILVNNIPTEYIDLRFGERVYWK
jgi:hypothetical protein